MKILHLGDLHIDENATLAGSVRRDPGGVNLRMVDLISAVGEIVRRAGYYDLAVITGDLYDHAEATNAEEAIAEVIVDALAQRASCGMTQRGVLIIDGNHDVPRGTGDAATKSLEWHPNVTVVHDPQVATVLGHKLGCLPYPRTGGNAELLKAGAVDLIATTLRAQGAEVLLAHANTGRATSGKQPRPIDDAVTLSHPVLDQFGAVMLGHIHRPQSWGTIGMVGSPLPEDWGETDGLGRGALLWSFDGSTWAHERIDVPSREWIDIPCDQWCEDEVDVSGGAVHRVKGRMSASDAAAIRSDIRSLRAKGAMIQDAIEVASESRVRVAEIEHALTDDQIIESAIRLKQPDASVVAGAMREVRAAIEGGAV